MLSTTFAFPTNELRSAMIATGSLAGAIKKMFYDEAMVDQVMGQMMASVEAIGQHPSVNGSGFNSFVSRKAVIAHMLEKKS